MGNGCDKMIPVFVIEVINDHATCKRQVRIMRLDAGVALYILNDNYFLLVR